MEIGCTCVMLLALLSPLSTVNVQDYASALSEYRKDILQQEQINQTVAEAFSRQVIEEKYAAYIINEAGVNDVVLQAVSVSTCEENGTWIPYEVIYTADFGVSETFKEHIKTQLGVPIERQYTNESTGEIESMAQ